MRIAFVSYDFGQLCIRQASALARRNEVLLVLSQQRAAAHLEELDPAVSVRLFRAPRLRQALRQIRTTYRLIRAIRRFKPDVIHFQHGHFWFNLLLPLLRRFPLVVTVHDVRHHLGDRESQRTPQWLMDFAYRRARQIIVHGRHMKQMVVDELDIPGERVHVVPHVAIGPKQIHKLPPENDHEILFFGRVWEYKGLEYLIRAEPLITAQLPEARIVIAGQGEDFDRYRRMMVHPDRFLVLNEWISEEKQAELFARASVVALPYTEASQSGVIPLAYTCAKPVVATTTGALPEMVDHGQTGYLVPPRDERALAEAIVRLLRDKQLRHRMGENGKKMLQARCSPEVVAEQTLEVYRHAIGEVDRPSTKRRPPETARPRHARRPFKPAELVSTGSSAESDPDATGRHTVPTSP